LFSETGEGFALGQACGSWSSGVKNIVTFAMGLESWKRDGARAGDSERARVECGVRESERE
jgi:hypothetical protein